MVYTRQQFVSLATKWYFMSILNQLVGSSSHSLSEEKNVEGIFEDNGEKKSWIQEIRVWGFKLLMKPLRLQRHL